MKKKAVSAQESRRRASPKPAVARGPSLAQLAILRIQKEIAVLDADLPDVLRVMVQRACELTGAHRGAILTAQGNELVCDASAGTNPLPEGTRMPLPNSMILRAIERRVAQVSDDTRADSGINQEFTLHRGTRSVVVVPVTAGEQVICGLSVASDLPNAFDAQNVVNLQVLVESYGAVIQRHRMSAQLRASESQYRRLFELNPQPMWVYDPGTLALLAVNQAMLAHYGYTAQEAQGMTMRDLWYDEFERREAIVRSMPPDHHSYNIQRRHRRKDGSAIDVDLSGSPIVFGGVKGRLVLATDITQRLRAERDLVRVSRAQQMLSTCNEALIRASSQDALLTEICRVTVDIGGYCGAWVGLARDDEARTVEPVAFFGSIPDHVLTQPISWSDQVPEGRRPAGQTIRSGQMVVIEDIARDLALDPLVTQVLVHTNIRGLISLPLQQGSRTFGLLLLYTSEPIRTTADEARLLQALANDLAFGMGNLRAQQEARRDALTRIEILRIQQDIASLDADLPQVLAVMAERARALTGAEGGVIDLVEGGALVCRASAGRLVPVLDSLLPLHGSVAGEVVRTAQTVVCDDVGTDPRFDAPGTRPPGVRSLVIVPLTVDSKVIGVLKVGASQLRAFSASDVANLQILVETLGATIQRHRMSEQLQASESQYRLLFDLNPHAMWVYATDSLKLLAVNQAMLRHYGYTEQDMLGMTIRDLWHDDMATRDEIMRNMPPEHRSYNVLRRHRRRDGTPIDVEISGSPIVFGGRVGRLVLATDVTQRLRAERDLKRVSRAQQMLSTCNEALIRATSQDALLNEICRITVDIGGYLGAWVGFARDDEDKTIEPVGFAGALPAYVHALRMSWADSPVAARRPATRTIRNGEAVIVTDIEQDRGTDPLVDVVLAAGIRGLISLPLQQAGRTFGVLMLYANEVIQATPDEVKLLQELANDLAFGIANLRSQQDARRDAQTRMEILGIQQEVASLSADLTQAMTVMAERARALTGAEGGVIDLIEGDELVCMAHSGSVASPLGSRLLRQHSLAGLAVQTLQAVVCDDADTDPRIDKAVARLPGMRSLIVVPMAVDGQVMGVLKVVSGQPRAFVSRDVANLQILVETLGATIKRHRMAAQLRASESQYRQLFAQNPQPMWVYDINSLRILAVNQAMVKHYGYSEPELLAMPLSTLWQENNFEREEVLRLRPLEERTYSIVRQHRKKDGTPIDVELSSGPILFDGAVGRIVLAMDVTQRLRAERDLKRVSRAQQMLSTCNEALIRATSQQALLTEICRITVDIGGYLGAWVGFARDDEARTIDRMAIAGVMPDDDPKDRASWSDQVPRGLGPAGRTIRSGREVIVEDVQQEDSVQLPRKAMLTALGVRSVISLPLRNAERTFGLLFLFGGEVVQVGTDEIKLLQELANDLAFGIGNLLAQEEQRRVQATVRDQAALLDKAQDAIVVRGMDDCTVFWNHSAERLYGWSAAEALGHPIVDLLYRDSQVFHEATRQVLHSGAWSGEVLQRRKDGSTLTVEARWTLVRDDRGEPQSILSIDTDITQRKAAENEIQRLAFYDPLTQLPNRLLLMDRLQQALAGSSRSGLGGALLFIDLDNFKTLNDTLGHDRGDMLLQQVAARLSACVRGADTVARLGGDEFVVMLEDLGTNGADTALAARAIGNKVLAALAEPYLLGGFEHRTTSSIGVAPFDARHEGVGELLKQADLAMYQAKTAGRNAIRFFDPTMQAIVNARAVLEFEMRLALTQQEFALHYQPQSAASGRVIGVEALLRWRHPKRGPVSPAEFIPLAEETGIIIPLGQWVLRTACDQLQAWQSSSHTAQLTMAVNVSARQFRSADFVDQVAQVLASSGADPGKLKLELTESLLVDDLDQVIAKMTALKALGVGFSLDDFGTGYSSLSYLKRLPLDQLKIDQSFVRDIMTDANDASIVRTIIALGQSLGLGVIAEGVETQAQRDYLAAHGCLAYQGYFFSRPLPLEELQAFLQATGVDQGHAALR